MRRMRLLMASCIALPGCVGPRSFLDYEEAVSLYSAEFAARGTTLMVRVFNLGGGNIERIDAVVACGYVKLYPFLVSAGPQGWSNLVCNVESPLLPSDWENRVLWVDPDGAEHSVAVKRVSAEK
jgi:hypothetical protein